MFAYHVLWMAKGDLTSPERSSRRKSTMSDMGIKAPLGAQVQGHARAGGRDSPGLVWALILPKSCSNSEVVAEDLHGHCAQGKPGGRSRSTRPGSWPVARFAIPWTVVLTSATIVWESSTPFSMRWFVTAQANRECASSPPRCSHCSRILPR